MIAQNKIIVQEWIIKKKKKKKKIEIARDKKKNQKGGFNVN